MTPTFDWSNLMNSTGNAGRSFNPAPGASAISSIFSPPAGASQQRGPTPGSPGLGSTAMNIMPQQGGQQPGENNLAAFLAQLTKMFQPQGMAAGGGAPGGGQGMLPTASPMASAMLAKRPQGSGGLF